MNCYYDTGILIKLYVEEPESESVREFVLGRGEAIHVNDLHLTEMTSAIVLKQFRGECSSSQSEQFFEALDEDRDSGVLRMNGVDWTEAWRLCRSLTMDHSHLMGCRTNDTLHFACAILSKASEFISSDQRQLELAHLVGLKTLNPVTCH